MGTDLTRVCSVTTLFLDDADLLDYQKTVANLPLSWYGSTKHYLTGTRRRVQILDSVDGVLEAGELLVVLGPPGRCAGLCSWQRKAYSGSGCTTLLKTIAGEMNGIYLDEHSDINYRGKSMSLDHDYSS